MFLMIQETCLVLLVTLVFVTPVEASIVVLCVIYLHILVFVMSYSYYYRIEYFKTKKVMYLAFAHKIIMPVMVVVPLKYKYLFFIFSCLFLVLELICDYLNDLFKQLNRLAIYKVVEFFTVVVLVVYYLVETEVKEYSSSRAAALTCSFMFALTLLIFVLV